MFSPFSNRWRFRARKQMRWNASSGAASKFRLGRVLTRGPQLSAKKFKMQAGGPSQGERPKSFTDKAIVLERRANKIGPPSNSQRFDAPKLWCSLNRSAKAEQLTPKSGESLASVFSFYDAAVTVVLRPATIS